MKEETCYSCSTPFSMTDEIYKQRLKDGKNFYCPAGHPQYYTQRKDEIEALKNKIESLEKSDHEAVGIITIRDGQIQNLKNSIRTYKGVISKLKKRIKQ